MMEEDGVVVVGGDDHSYTTAGYEHPEAPLSPSSTLSEREVLRNEVQALKDAVAVLQAQLQQEREETRYLYLSMPYHFSTVS